MYIVLFTTVFTGFVVRNLSLVELSENYFSDLRVALLSPIYPPSPLISVVLIDEKALTNVAYQSPIDRKLIVDLIEELEKRSVEMIGLNLRFDRPTEKNKDQYLYEKLRSSTVPIVVSRVSNQTGYSQKQVDYSNQYLENLDSGLSLIYRDTTDHTVRASLIRLRESKQVSPSFITIIANQLGIDVPRVDQMFIDYRRGKNDWSVPFNVISAADVSNLPLDALQGQVILIGSDLGHTTRLRTPFSVVNQSEIRDLPGVIIEAQVLSQLIDGRTINRPNQIEVYLIITSMALLGWLISTVSLNFIVKVFLPPLLLIVTWLSVLVLYTFNGSLLPVLSPSIGFLIAVVLTSFWQWRFEKLKREKVHQLFGQFVAPAVVQEIINNPEKQGLDGELREVTFIFTDLEGFTSLTETTKPAVMVNLVNQYLDEACAIVLAHGGTIDKIVGDALHIMFNAPIKQPAHANKAVQCALELNQWSKAFQAKQQSRGINLGKTRIGINTGNCIVGNFGGNHRFDYTAYGDAINSTARLEAINKNLGTNICVSETTANQCNGIEFQPIGNLYLRGKSESIMTYTPVINRSEHKDRFEQYLDAFSQLSSGDSAANKTFASLLSQFPDDPLIKLHYQRTRKGDATIDIHESSFQ